jgi:hypothetical protein
MNKAICISDPTGIQFARLASMKGAVKLESKGMKMSRGLNVTAMARKELGLKARAPHSEVIEAIEKRMTELMEQRRVELANGAA